MDGMDELRETFLNNGGTIRITNKEIILSPASGVEVRHKRTAEYRNVGLDIDLAVKTLLLDMLKKR